MFTDAVLVSTRTAPCPDCGNPMIVFNVELGHVFRVDLETRATKTIISHAGAQEIEMVLDDQGDWIPTEPLRSSGRPL